MYKILRFLFILTVCLILNIQNTKADIGDYIPHKMIVQTEQDLSSENPPTNFSVIVDDDYEVKDLGVVEKGTKFYFEVIKVSDPKIAKRDATIKARMLKVYNPKTNKTTIINNSNITVKISNYEEINKADVVSNVGIGAAGLLVKHITVPAHFVKGMVQNEEGNRLQSGVKEVYDTSPLSYIQKGEELELKAGDLATMTYFTKD